MRIIYKTLPWLFRIAILSMAYFCFDDYLTYKNIIDQNTPKIAYSYLSKRTTTGRNRNYYINVWYKNQPYQVDINQEIYNDVDKGKLLPLYYLPAKNRVFTPAKINYMLKLTIVAIVFFFASFIPIQKIEDRIRGNK